MKWSFCIVLGLLGSSFGQQAGTLTEEYRPSLPLQVCEATSCTVEETWVVLDADSRYLYSVADSAVSCQPNGSFDPELCPDGLTCALNCAIDGIDQNGYNNVHGVSSTNSELRLNYVTESAQGTVVGSRLYLVSPDDEYRLFYLKNHELAFDVDLSRFPCGLNAALYFSEMEADGGMVSYPSNGAGAKYGTGYCDGQCIHYLKYSIGEVNLQDSSVFGICCTEMDILEANRYSEMHETIYNQKETSITFFP